MLKLIFTVVLLVFLGFGQGNAQGKTAELLLEKTYTGFHSPTGIAVDHEGNLYVSNWSGGDVTKIDTKGNRTVFADNMGAPAGLAFDNDGNLYVADYSQNVIYRIAKNKNKVIFARGLHTPTGISFNKKGELLVANRSSNEIVKVNVSGRVELVANGMRTPVGVVEDLDGNLYVTNYGGSIIKVFADGTARAFSNDFGRPGVGIGISPQNEIFATDNGDGRVRILLPNGKTRTVVDGISGCVALLIHGTTLYVGSWGTGNVYKYRIK
ncbi:hypothetical protein AGMMS49941_05350 [Deferribacterales bacterium]|nr:hypothetical protein AGMMS49941_05350 [Deferribacterales bacterium]